MKKRSKRYQKVSEEVDKSELYAPEEAVKRVKETATADFDETIDLSTKLGVQPQHADQNIRGTIVLPAGIGQEVTVAVFAKGEKAREAEEAGADYVGQEDLAERIEGGWMDFDVALATPDMMSLVGPLGRILGPQGLMPNPKAGTVTFELQEAVEEFKAGKLEYRVDDVGNLHLPIGKASFSEADLMENFKAIMNRLLQERPAAASGRYLQTVVLSSTMGPGIKVNPNAVINIVTK